MANEAPPVVLGSSKARHAFVSAGFRRHVSRALIGAGTIFLVGTVVDFVVLWLGRQPVPEWEFTALAGTTDGLPRLMLALALFYVALYTLESTSLLAYRLLAMGVLVLALASAVIAPLMLTNHFALRPEIDPDGVWLFNATTIKTLGLCALYIVILVPLGVLGLRRPMAR